MLGAGGGLTWFEEHHGLHAGKFRGVDGQCLEATKGLLQRPHVQGGWQQLPRGRLGHSQEWAALQGHGPLDGTEQEQLTPCFLQQNHLGRAGKTPKPLSPPKSRGPVATTAGWADKQEQGNPKDVVEMLQLPQLAAIF